MLLTSKLLSLPASILFLITAHTTTALQNDRLANNPPENARRIAVSPDQRDVEARDEPMPLGRTPVGVMKMSDDPSQKFYMHYWGYEDDLPESNPSDIPPAPLLRPRDEDEEAILLANSSAAISYRAPFALHTDEIFGLRHLESRGRISGRDAAGAALAALQKRQFECPSGTSACTSIGYPNSCCATDETCFKIQDTGLGPVGCCPSGDTCGGTISGCNSPNTPCAENEGGNYEGGGCCIPNYVCAGVGCIPSPSASSEVIGGTTTVVVVVTPSSTPPKTTSTSVTKTSSHGSIATETVTSTASGNAPARATGSTSSGSASSGSASSGSASSGSASSTSPATTEAPGSCPTGFYGCEAYNAGGCCRTGRNCATTDCPPASSTTLVSSGVTLIVPVGPAATLATASGSCPSGWASCAASLGGNCCLSGWQCGTASCTSISPSSTQVGQKDSPSMGIRGFQKSAGLLIGSLMFVLMCI